MAKGEKKTLYARLFRTSEYYLYDPFSQEFIAYHLRGGVYEEVPPDAAGTVASPATGLVLGSRGGWLRWLTPEGVVLPTPRELAEQERQRAELAHQQAAEALQRATQAEQVLAEYRRRFGPLEEP